MTKVTIPAGPAQPLDPDRVAVLVRDALLAAARELRSARVESSDRHIYRRLPSPQVGWQGVALPAPNYRKSIWDVRAPAAACTEARALIDYVWDAGALPKTLTQDGEGVPGKEAWSDFTWVDLVQAPFLYLCALSATRRLSETGTYDPWHIDPAETEAAARDVAQTTCLERRSVRALCPIVWAHIPDGLSATLRPGVALRDWSLDEKCLFLTRYHQEYVDDDPSTWASGGLIEINLEGLPADKGADDMVVHAVTAELDLVKWALMVTANSAVTLGEGGIVLRSPAGWKGPTIRRQDTTMPRNGARSSLVLDERIARDTSTLLDQAQKLISVAPELKSILWFLGRSHTSATSRDSLLEAAIGLEALLVPDAGESTYKFRLHGAALLSSVIEEDVDGDLKRIYELRSKAAHGTAREEEDFERLAPRARYYLAKAIVATVQLTETGEYRLDETKGDLGKATKALVRRRCLLPQPQPPSNPALNPTGLRPAG